MLSQYCSDEVHGFPRHWSRRTVRAIPTSHGPRERSRSRVAIPRASRELPLIPSLLPPAALGLGVLARATAAGRNKMLLALFYSPNCRPDVPPYAAAPYPSIPRIAAPRAGRADVVRCIEVDFSHVQGTFSKRTPRF